MTIGVVLEVPYLSTEDQNTEILENHDSKILQHSILDVPITNFEIY